MPPEERKRLEHRNKTSSRYEEDRFLPAFRLRTAVGGAVQRGPAHGWRFSTILRARLSGALQLLLLCGTARFEFHHPIFRVFLVTGPWRKCRPRTKGHKKVLQRPRDLHYHGSYELLASFDGCALPSIDLSVIFSDTVLLAPKDINRWQALDRL